MEAIGAPRPDVLEKLRAEIDAELEGAYVLERFLGDGSFATVWLARPRGSEERVALKRCPAGSKNQRT
ncbi:MAG: hypothetical protein ACRDD1_19915, partial [Planctomycetia bacterium]